MEGVSFVVPVHNGALCIRQTLEAILAQADGRPMEVIVVEDRSGDDSAARLARLAEIWPIRVIEGDGRGAAAAINRGIRAARFPIVCQVDQDVAVGPGWMRLLTAALHDPGVAAAQGYYESDPEATLCARAMGRDLEQRYDGIDGAETDQVCTGNSAYRVSALEQVGLFDESFGYGYDNDISYRLRGAGFRLVICRDARSRHRWREGVTGYLLQQYGFGYGRIDLIAKHPGRLTGDSVSPSPMMAHPVVMAAALAGLGLAALAALAGWTWRPFAGGAALLVGGLALERLAAGIVAARRFRDPTPLVFPLLHLGRDLAWVAAIGVWIVRRLAGRPPRPAHSMHPRQPAAGIARGPIPRSMHSSAPRKRVLCIVPAHNEAASLSSVVGELRSRRRDLDVLVIDDGSTDGTSWLLEQLGVCCLRLPERMGIGSAMRAGLRYAARLGYEAAVRIDGDGQHSADDIARLLVPIDAGVADVVLGSRYTERERPRAGVVGMIQRALGACLSAMTGRPVTDPTSGFCVLGASAIRILAEHHPTGYPEPELRLFLSRNVIRVLELPVRRRSRQNGRTSLTPVRLTAASARVVLAMLIVPFRQKVAGAAGD